LAARFTQQPVIEQELETCLNRLMAREREPIKIKAIARSKATKQSMFPLAAPWIASRSLSSGAHSRDPLARNDGGWVV
jgi:hypothetical protein